jgi:hypothetical protein
MIPDEPKPREPGIGHNQPKSPVDELVVAQREALTSEKRERLEYIIAKAEAKDVVDRETAGQAGDIIKVADEFTKLIDNDRIDRTRPYRDAADRAKGIADEFLEPLRAAIERLHARLDAWSDAEDERIKAQQAEQEAFFAKPDLTPSVQSPTPPPMMPAKRRKITGDLGARVTQVDVKQYRVVDIRAVPDFILNSETVKAAVVQVAKSLGKHMSEIDGIEIATGTANRVQ